MGKWIVGGLRYGHARDVKNAAGPAGVQVSVPLLATHAGEGMFEFVVPSGLSEPEVREHISRCYGVPLPCDDDR